MVEIKNIKSIVKAARVIDILANAENSMALSAIAKELDMAKSTLHGIISTLVDIGYVVQDPETGRYLLGFKLFEIGSSVSRKWNERKIAAPFIQQLAEETGETIHLAVLDSGKVLYISKQEASGSIRIVTESGTTLPAHCTGVGKVLLSGLTPHTLKEVVTQRGLAKYTEHTITDFEALKQEIERIQLRGYAIDDQEFVEGLRCVAMPIYNHQGKVSCALSISGPISRMRDDDLEQKIHKLEKASRAISIKMGYQGGFPNV